MLVSTRKLEANRTPPPILAQALQAFADAEAAKKADKAAEWVASVLPGVLSLCACDMGV